MCLVSVDGRDEMQVVTLNLLRGLKQSFFSKMETPFSYNFSNVVLEAIFNYMDS